MERDLKLDIADFCQVIDNYLDDHITMIFVDEDSSEIGSEKDFQSDPHFATSNWKCFAEASLLKAVMIAAVIERYGLR